jgi:hypothetical protein
MRVDLLWQYAMELRNMDEHCCSSDGNDRRAAVVCCTFAASHVLLSASASLTQVLRTSQCHEKLCDVSVSDDARLAMAFSQPTMV